VAVVVFGDDAQVRFYLDDFNNFSLPASPDHPDDYVYTQIHALNAISSYYPCVSFFLALRAYCCHAAVVISTALLYSPAIKLCYSDLF